ncbi:putative IlvE, branched-chain amino acid aminotransferase/4-amino-4-deoxychorismate lyase [Dunaliella salina]|uniref:IlvE, branched-chain amino acid aminotransferase/4-amino-4-deoxychorismate lyase n=1 Tax=Dunaliella salina TaxID=3046 RepID=A0ABQ7FYM7_DUNSA|nr:putative IlvE, branched-chain amino acid aminotransferase/4-amino-4-deoxychorismate lyase [Dunaliella salina]|eukprot:KAF5827453.1 putative IlvE, branched-chain amino acid aminotransferase/4-amino-4-deoxychorismate lyase [Dunaliella salina]
MPGITRGKVLQICFDDDIPCKELDFKLAQVYSADEAFVTGTFAGLVPVRQVDGRVIGSVRAAMEGRTISDQDWVSGPVTRHLQQLYMQLKDRDAQAAQRRR